MGKRVYEVAEELGVEAKQIVLRLKESGVDVKGRGRPSQKTFRRSKASRGGASKGRGWPSRSPQSQG